MMTIETKKSGILLPIFSLPSRGGIGSAGEAARRFADFLADAGQSVWQVLPANPTGYGDSPYQPLSSFAGNPYFIPLDGLVSEGLLSESELPEPERGRVDYGRLYRERPALLRLAHSRFGENAELERFVYENQGWLPDYALFMAVKKHFGGAAWSGWDEDIRLREKSAVERYSEKLRDETRFQMFLQYEFFRHWAKFKHYVNQNGLLLIGDLPFYPAPDSCDVWAAREFFQLSPDGAPKAVAGVPPDYFSENGQLWGNPLYDWGALEKSGWAWWLERFGAAARLFDAVRLDHFRGLESYWSVPWGETTAKNGKWLKGPGESLIAALRAKFPKNSVIAEDLGFLTPEVRELLAFSGWPGMSVLQFELLESPSPVIEKNRVCYTGTHDNPPLAAWTAERGGDAEAILRLGLESGAFLFVAQMQDWLGLGADSRTNTPSTAAGNWGWRLDESSLTPALASKIRNFTRSSGRAQ